MIAPLRRNSYLALAALLTSSGTLVCCVLPAIMVTLGAGATLAGIVSALPQLVWLSEHKPLVFGVAALMLAVAGASIWRARMLPCPSDPVAARACVRLRRFSAMLYALSALVFCIGVTFALVLPAFGAELPA
jgi:Na+/melibiose symporter-like transporter